MPNPSFEGTAPLSYAAGTADPPDGVPRTLRSSDPRTRDYDGVTRYASKTASMFRKAVKSVRSDFTSPTWATYQFFAI
jgi:hypothetical protein